MMRGGEAESREAGFTLVEMLVALALFAAVAAMGVAMLRSSVDTQDAVHGRLAAMSGFNRLRSVMGADLSQALDRPTRDERGAVVPAFSGTATEFSFVQAGADGLDGRSRPDAVRVRYGLDDGAWTRGEQPWLDGAVMPKGDALARDVERAGLRYRDAAGVWQTSWPVAGGAALPRAVEVVIRRRGAAPLTMLFLVAPMAVDDRPRGAAI
jgi:general secretion pathway protein J